MMMTMMLAPSVLAYRSSAAYAARRLHATASPIRSILVQSQCQSKAFSSSKAKAGVVLPPNKAAVVHVHVVPKAVPPHAPALTTSSTSTSSTSTTSFWSRFSNPRWKSLARIVRYTRIPFLVLSVYGLGYQQGIIDDSRNPEQTRQSLLDNVYASVGVSDRKHVHIVQDGESLLKTSSNKDVKRIAKIGRSIVKVARKHVQQKCQEIAKELHADILPIDLTEEQFTRLLLENEDFQLWHKAKSQLDGNWSYLLLETQLPNAFVSEILPKRIFVTIAMLDIIENDDELALVLGHEVSHLILGHVSQRNMVETVMRTVEVLLLSLDPTEGLLSLALVGSLATLRQAFSASFSREHEREADELGIKLAAMACYDTHRASAVFSRLHEREKTPTTTSNLLSFVDSHPPTADRYRDLVAASETENAEMYTDNCTVVKRKMDKSAGSGKAGLLW